MAVGAAGAILGSTDATNWISRQAPTTNQLSGVAYGNGQFVAVGDAMMTSIDGVNWAEPRLPISANAFGAVTFANGQFLAVATTIGVSTDGFIMLTSPDGTNWVQRSTTSPLLGDSYGDGQFVATDGVNLTTSVNGEDWVLHPSVLPKNEDYTGFLNSLAYGNGQYVAVGDDGAVLSSSDGATWVRREPKELTAISLWDIAYGNGRFVAVGESFNNSTGQWKAFSETFPDGSTWTQGHVGLAISFAHLPLGSLPHAASQLAYGNGLFVASGY